MKKKINKTAVKKTIMNFIVTISLVEIALADNETSETAIKNKIDSWGGSFWDIAQSLLKWGGIVSFVCLGLYLYFTNDEQGAKKAKIGLAVSFFAALVGVMAKSFVGIFK